MTRPARYDILFEPVRIGPLVARNRFFQAPHCNGMGRHFPSAMAAMRGVKAEGCWAVVSTEQCDVHYSGNHLRELRLWDERDIPHLARATDSIHGHDALASVELVHNGHHVPNLESRAIPIAHAVHPEPDDGRGVAARLAPRAHPAEEHGRHDPDRRRRASWSGGRTRAGAARVRRHADRPGPRARRARHPGVQASGPRLLGGRPRLAPHATARHAQRPGARWRGDHGRPGLESGASLVAVATGASWRAHGVGRAHSNPIPGRDGMPVLTPDDVMDGRLPSGRVVLFDDDHYYMGGVLTEHLVDNGCQVTFVTPESLVSAYTQFTNEQARVQRHSIGIKRCRWAAEPSAL